MRNPQFERSHLPRSGWLRGALVTSLVVAAPATLFAIENWGRSVGLVVGGSVLAAITIVATVVQQRTGLRRAEARLLRAHVRRLDRGRLPRVGALRDAAGARPARALVDPRLAEALRLRWFVVVTGDHAAQAAADAMRAVWPHRRLLVPIDGHALAMLLAELDLGGTVVWLGDLDEFLRRDAAAVPLIDRLATVPDLTVVATRMRDAPDRPPEMAEALRRAIVITATEPDLLGPAGDPILPLTPPERRLPRRAGWRLAGVTALVMVANGLAADAVLGPPACGFPAELRVVTSVELTPIVRDLVVEFRREVNRGGCQQANIQVQATVSAGATIEALARGWSRHDQRDLTFAPDLVIPDSTVDVERVQLALQGSQSTDVTLVPQGSIALSPVALAAPRSMLGRLAEAHILDQGDGTDRTFRWRDLIAAAGEVTFARASPRTSSVGFAATVALYRAALSVEPGATLERQRLTASGAASGLRSVELGVATNHEETSGLLCAMRIASTVDWAAQAPVSAKERLVLPLVAERSIVDYNEGRPLGGACAASTDHATDPLVPLTATEGTPVLDYPVVRVDYGRLQRSRHRQEMMQRFVAFLHQGTAQARLHSQGFRDHSLASDNPHIPADRPVRVALPGGQQINDLLTAWEQARRPARMLMAVDISRAMSTPSRGSAGDQLDAAVAAIRNSLRFIGDRDEVGLWVSAQGLGQHGYQELVPIGPYGGDIGAESRAQVLIGHLNGLQARPVEPAIASTLSAGIDWLRSHDPAALQAQANANTALVLFTAAGAGTAGVNLSRTTGRQVPIFLIVFGADGCRNAVAPTLREAIVDSAGECITVESATDVSRAMDGLAAALWSGQR